MPTLQNPAREFRQSLLPPTCSLGENLLEISSEAHEFQQLGMYTGVIDKLIISLINNEYTSPIISKCGSKLVCMPLLIVLTASKFNKSFGVNLISGNSNSWITEYYDVRRDNSSSTRHVEIRSSFTAIIKSQ